MDKNDKNKKKDAEVKPVAAAKEPLQTDGVPRASRPAEGKKSYVYNGDTIPGTRLKHGAIFRGSKPQVLEYFNGKADAKDFVPVSKYIAKRRKAK
jgi:hypothetical protein